MNKTLKQLPLYLFLTGLILILTSCSVTKVYKEVPDYDNPRYKFNEIKQKNIVISEVIDKRFGQSRSSNAVILSAPVSKKKKHERNSSHNDKGPDITNFIGLFDDFEDDEYLYKFSDPIEVFVKKSLEKILVDSLSPNPGLMVPVKVNIDTINIEDEGNFFTTTIKIHCEMTFIYNDETGEKSIKTHFNDSFVSAGDRLHRVQFLVYDCIYDCSRQFIEEFAKTNPTLANTQNMIKDSTGSTKIQQSYKEQFDYKKAYISEFSPFCQFGSNISGRVGISMILYNNKKDSYFLHGAGTRLSFFVAESGQSRATYWGGNFCYSPILFTSKSQEGLFFNPSVDLILGMEGFNSKSFFFIGPMITEYIGVKIGSFSLKAGAYQLKIWGSEALSSDIGFSFEIGFYAN